MRVLGGVNYAIQVVLSRLREHQVLNLDFPLVEPYVVYVIYSILVKIGKARTTIDSSEDDCLHLVQRVEVRYVVVVT